MYFIILFILKNPNNRTYNLATILIRIQCYLSGYNYNESPVELRHYCNKIKDMYQTLEMTPSRLHDDLCKSLQWGVHNMLGNEKAVYSDYDIGIDVPFFKENFNVDVFIIEDVRKLSIAS